MRLPQLKVPTLKSFIPVMVLVVICLSVIAGSHIPDLKNQVLQNEFYKKIYQVFYPEPVKEVEPEKEEVNPEVTLLAAYIKSRNSRLPIEIAEIISESIIQASARHNIPIELLTGMIEKESIFNPMASTEIPGKNQDHARGLMQIYQGESVQVDVKQAYDITYNLGMGCSILNKKLELNNGDLERALSNYSGNAQGYADDVLKGVGRFNMYKWKKTIEENQNKEIAMIEEKK